MDSNSTGSITSSASPLTVIETTSREPPATDFRDEFIATVRVAVLGVALFLTMAGNIVVLVLVLQSKPKSAHLSRIYYFLLHLSIADILVGIFNISPQLVWDIYFRFPLGNFACKIVKFLQVFVLYLSTYVLAGMAVDRYLAIRSGINRPIVVVRTILSVSWLVAAVLASPQLYIFSFQKLPNGAHDCWATFEPPITSFRYVLFFITAVLFIPVTLMALCYTYLSWIISKRSLSHTKLNPIRMTMVMVIVFVLCWTPFCCAQLYLESTGQVPSIFITLFLLVPNLNSCANPWVCLTFSTTLRRKLTDALSFFGFCEHLSVYRSKNAITISILQYRPPNRSKRQPRAYRGA